VTTVPAVSAVTVDGSQPDDDAISDCGSETAQLMATLLVYQPFAPSVPETVGEIVGELESYLKFSEALVATPAPFLHEPLTDPVFVSGPE